MHNHYIFYYYYYTQPLTIGYDPSMNPITQYQPTSGLVTLAGADAVLWITHVCDIMSPVEVYRHLDSLQKSIQQAKQQLAILDAFTASKLTPMYCCRIVEPRAPRTLANEKHES